VKQWYDMVWLLDDPNGSWQQVGQLPRPNAYGVSASVPGGVICAGGGDSRQHFKEVLQLVWRGGRLQVDPLPPLPQPCAFASGALVGNTFYIAGGIDRPDATSCLRTFWALDVAQPNAAWRVLEPCPGPERTLAVAGATDKTFYLFSGTRLSPDAEGKPQREYLRDAWCYHPSNGWKRLADLPRAAVAAPSPAAQTTDGRLLIASGDDGVHVGFKPDTEHPGFPRDILSYDPKADRWTVIAGGPFSRATAPTAEWRGMTVVVSGEERPGYRSPKVWGLPKHRGD
jgi:N-acetylneuraminic acid mutarotase